MPFFQFQLANARRLMAGVLLGLGACNHAPGSAPATTPIAPAVPPPISPPALSEAAADSATQTAVRFFAWYQRHRVQANGFSFLSSALDADTTQAAGVSFPQVNQFLRLLRSSNCVSAAYLNDWDAYFHQQADELHYASIDGDLVSGFDFELVLYSQEGDHYLERMAKVPKKVTRPASDRAVVTALFSADSSPDNKVFYLRRYTSGWLIDSIRH
jgi:hypothetical protein